MIINMKQKTAKHVLLVLLYIVNINDNCGSAPESDAKLFRNRELLQQDELVRLSEYDLSTVGCDPTFEDCANKDMDTDSEAWCTDVAPEGALLSCSEYATKGLCPVLDPGFCAKSCGQCCQDVDVPGTTCDSIVSLGLCDDPDLIADTFCLRSCGFCEVPPSATPVQTQNPVSSDVTPETYIQEQEAEALLVFKNAISDSNELGSWNGKNPCNSWAGITCQNERVYEIRLGFGNFELSSGTKTWYHTQPIVGDLNTAIPSEWSILQNLSQLELGGIGLVGSLPSSLSACTSLEVIQLGKNKLGGNIPDAWSEWQQMKLFYVYENDIQGSIPNWITQWSQLLSFNVHSNQLTGTLPPQFTAFSALEDLYINNNYLKGTLPPQYSMFSDFIGIDISDNSLTGQVPVEWSLLSSVGNLNIFSQNGYGLCAPHQLVRFDGSDSDLC